MSNETCSLFYVKEAFRNEDVIAEPSKIVKLPVVTKNLLFGYNMGPVLW